MSSVFNYVGSPVGGLSLPEAISKAQLDWTVSKRPIFVQSGVNRDLSSSSKFFATCRDDTNAILGVVGTDYKPVQNNELAYLCERVAKDGVKIQTAGSIDGGRRVWFQMTGDAFDVGPKKDVNIPMTLFTNGHDGQNPLSGLPTTQRVICENTLNMALSHGNKHGMIISFKHMGDMQSRLESMIDAISDWKHRTVVFQEKAEAMARKELNVEGVQNFWVNLYINMIGDIHPDDSTEQRKEDNKAAGSVLTKWSNTFDSEVRSSGANLWTAMNSVTYWLDHQQIYRGERKHESRFNDTLFGKGAKEKINVMNYALSTI